jgi:hypothetical protein
MVFAEDMARTEAAMMRNKEMIAAYRYAGYGSIWRSAPGCCLSFSVLSVSYLAPIERDIIQLSLLVERDVGFNFSSSHKCPPI